MKTVEISSQFPVPADAVWERVRRTSTLFQVTAGLVEFLDLEQFPEYWQTGTEITTRLRLFNRLPGGLYHIKVQAVEPEDRRIVTLEHGGLVREWQHEMRVDEISPSSCRYVDRVWVDAGVLSQPLQYYVRWYYRQRHERWQSVLGLQ
ncbi:MAG: hypothetical protein ACOC4E_01825 [Patescibacteria group bacterium]